MSAVVVAYLMPAWFELVVGVFGLGAGIGHLTVPHRMPQFEGRDQRRSGIVLICVGGSMLLLGGLRMAGVL